MLISKLRKTLGESSDLRAFVISFAPTLAALAMQLGVFVLMGRSLGAVQFGQLSAVLALVIVLVEVVALGSGDILVRAVVRRPERFADYFGNTLILGGLSLPMAVAAAYVIATRLLRVDIDPAPLIVLVTCETLNARVSATVENIFVAHRDVVRASVVRLCTALARFALAAAVLGWAQVKDLDTWIWFTAGQSILTSMVFLAMAANRYGAPHARIVVKELGAGVLFAINQTARAAQSNLDRAVMVAIAEGGVVGAYAAASRIVQLALFPIQIANRLLYPRFFAHGHQGGLTATRAFAVRCAPLQFGIGLLSGVGISTAAFAVPSLMGSEFAGTTPITLGLACALPFLALQYPAADALTGAGRQGLRTVIFTVTAVVFSAGLALGARLGGLWGVVGAFIGGHVAIAALLWGLLFSLKPTATEASAASELTAVD